MRQAGFIIPYVNAARLNDEGYVWQCPQEKEKTLPVCMRICIMNNDDLSDFDIETMTLALAPSKVWLLVHSHCPRTTLMTVLCISPASFSDRKTQFESTVADADVCPTLQIA